MMILGDDGLLSHSLSRDMGRKRRVHYEKHFERSKLLGQSDARPWEAVKRHCAH